MELTPKDEKALNHLKAVMGKPSYQVYARIGLKNFIQTEVQDYCLALQWLLDFDPRQLLDGIIVDQDGTRTTIDTNELQRWGNGSERYRIEVQYLNHDQGKWIPYHKLITGYENAKCFEPSDFYAYMRIIRVFDNKVMYQEGSKVFKLIFSDGTWTYRTNCSLKMAETIGAAACRKNGTDPEKLMIVEASRR